MLSLRASHRIPSRRAFLLVRSARSMLCTQALPVKFEDISRAELRIRDGIINTDCFHSAQLSSLTGLNVNLKVDNRQITGSFKERGARNALMMLTPEEKANGVICASAGNHALAMSYHGRTLGISVSCVMPTIAPITKVNNCRMYDANVIQYGEHIGEAFEHAMEIAQEEGRTYINGYDHPHIIAGAGTMALEILRQCPDVEVLVIPVGGAGLIAGMSLAAKSMKPDIYIVGVEPNNCPSFVTALTQGDVCRADVRATLADGLAVPTVGRNAFQIARQFVDETVLVEDSNIAITVLRLLELEKLVVEGGGATGLAAILSGQLNHLRGKKIVVPLCGGNIDVTTLSRVIDRGLAADQRLVRFSVIISDRPGGLAQVTQLIMKSGASVRDVSHSRAWVHQDVFSVEISLVVETTGRQQAEKLKETLIKEDIPLKWSGEWLTEQSTKPTETEACEAARVSSHAHI